MTLRLYNISSCTTTVWFQDLEEHRETPSLPRQGVNVWKEISNIRTDLRFRCVSCGFITIRLHGRAETCDLFIVPFTPFSRKYPKLFGISPTIAKEKQPLCARNSC